jgi:hypothetical protein
MMKFKDIKKKKTNDSKLNRSRQNKNPRQNLNMSKSKLNMSRSYLVKSDDESRYLKLNNVNSVVNENERENETDPQSECRDKFESE